MPHAKKRLAHVDTATSEEVPRYLRRSLRARIRRLTPRSEPQSLSYNTHSIFWTMPTESALFDAFHPFLANNIIKSTWRNNHKTCFCDLALHHIQELMTPIDVVADCPEDGYSFMKGLGTIFAAPVMEAIDEDLTVISQHTSVLQTNMWVSTET